MIIVLYMLVGLAIGGISGVLGIGGGVLLVPVLTWFSYTQKQAQGITLAVLVLPVVAPAVWRYYASETIRAEHLATAAWIAAGFAVGGLIGGHFVHQLPLSELRLLFGLLLLYVAVRYIVTADDDMTKAALGLAATAWAWLAFIGLRLIGRRYATRPDLGEAIRALQTPASHESDYYI